MDREATDREQDYETDLRAATKPLIEAAGAAYPDETLQRLALLVLRTGEATRAEFTELWRSPAQMPAWLCSLIARQLWYWERTNFDGVSRRPFAERRHAREKKRIMDLAASVLLIEQRREEQIAAARGEEWALYDEGRSGGRSDSWPGYTTIFEETVAKAVIDVLAFQHPSAIRALDRDFASDLETVRAGVPRLRVDGVNWLEALHATLRRLAEASGTETAEERLSWQRLNDLWVSWWNSVADSRKRFFDRRYPDAGLDDPTTDVETPAEKRDEPPINFDGLVLELMDRWRIFDRREAQALHRRAKRERLTQPEMKRRALEVGVRLAYAARYSEWKPRTDSRDAPKIPARDLDAGEFSKWLRRESIRAARLWLLDRPYPPAGDFDTHEEPTAEAALEDLNYAGELIGKEGAVLVGESDADAADADLSAADVSALLAELQGLATPEEWRTVETFLAVDRPSWAVIDRALGRSQGVTRQLWKRLKDKYVRSKNHRL